MRVRTVNLGSWTMARLAAPASHRAHDSLHRKTAVLDLILRDVTLISSGGRQVADLAIEDGQIAAIGSVSEEAREVIECIGKFVIPGIIDTQARVSAGPAGASDWRTQTRAAVAAGITSLVELPGPPGVPLSARLEAAKAGSLCHHGRWIAATGSAEQTLSALDDGQALAPLLRLDEPSGPGLAGLEALVSSEPGQLVGVHAEDAARFVEGSQRHEARPAAAALAATEAVLALARANPSAALHLTSLSTSAELSLLDPFRGDLGLTSAVSPHSLFLSIEASAQKLGSALSCDPPVRSELDRRALWASMKRGRIDVACSRHHPVSRADKEAGALGMPGVGLFFPLLMSAVKHGRISLERVVEMCCEAPARIFGLEGKGRIEVGADADLVVMVEGRTERLTAPPSWSAADWTPYVGREAGVAPPLVVVGGQVAARSGVVDESATGASALRCS